jgi:hypothetical protein
VIRLADILMNYFPETLKRLQYCLIISIVFLLSSKCCYSQKNYTWSGNINNDWADSRNWNMGNVPGVSDSVTIPSQPTGNIFPNINSAAFAAFIIIQTDASLTMTGGILQITYDWKNSGTFNASGGIVQFTGTSKSPDFSKGQSNFYSITVNASAVPGFDKVPNSRINIAGDFINKNAGLGNQLSSTFNFNGTGDQIFSSASVNAIAGTFLVNKSAGTLTLASSIKAGNCTITSGSFSTSPNNYNLIITGNAAINGGNLNLNNSSLSCNSFFEGGGTVTGETFSITTVDYNRTGLAMTAPNATIFVSGNWTNSVPGNVNVSSVCFMGATKSIGGTAATSFPALIISNSGVNSAIVLNSDASCSSLLFTNFLFGVYLTISPGVNLIVNGDVTINQAVNGSNSHALNVYGNAIINGNLIFSVTGSYGGRLATLAVYSGGTVNIKGDITMNNTFDPAMCVIDMSDGGGTVYLGGNFNLLKFGKLSQGVTNTNFVYNGTATQTIIYGTTITYRTLTIDKADGIAIFNNPITVFNFSLLRGNVSAGTNTLTVVEDFLNDGGDFTDLPAVIFSGSNNSISGSALTHFGPITFLRSGGNSSYTITGKLASTGLFIPASTTAMVNLSSGGEMFINGNVTLNQPTINTTSAWTIGGTATVTGSISLNSSSYTPSSIIKISITGVLNANGDIIYNCVSNANTCIDMTGGSGMLNLQGSLNLLRSAGTFSSSTTSSLNLSGTSSQIIGLSTQFKFNDISITNPVSVALQSNGTVTSVPVTGNLSIRAGVFNNGGMAINMSPGKTLAMFDGATFRLIGNSGMVSGTGITKRFSANSTVDYAGTTQAVSAETYGHLLLSGTTLNASGNSNVLGNITIGAGATFNAGAYTHRVYKSFTNNGSFIASSGSIEFTGTQAASISGVIAFRNLTINKTDAIVSLQTNVSAATVSMTAGTLNTGSNMINISSERSGNGIILGTITRSHTFSSGVAYAFESPNNTITFSSPSSISSVTVSITTGTVSDFTDANSINRQYSITIPSGTYLSAKLRLHYENSELNGLSKSALELWKYSSGWMAMSTTAADTSLNYVELSGITTTSGIAGRWTLSGCNLKTSFTYQGTPYCTTGGIASVSFTNGGSAGTFSSIPSGLVLNSTTGDVNPGSSSPGTYTITNTKTNGSCSSISTTSITINAAGRWTGGVDSDWNKEANWLCGEVPTRTINVLLPAGLTNYPVITSGTISVNNITIEANASITLTNATMQVAGSIKNNGCLSAAAAVVEMNGNTAQTIPATAFLGNTVKGITINNPAGVSLSGSLAVSEVLTITNGSFNTGGYLTLTSNSDSKGRIAPVTTSAPNPIIGNVTVQQYIPGKRKYRLITSPVNTSSSSSLSAGQEGLSIWGNWQNAGITSISHQGTYITGGTVIDGFDQLTTNPSMFTYDAVNRKFVPFSSATGNKTKYTPLKAGVPYYFFIYGDRLDKVNTATPNFTVLNATGTLITGDQNYTTASAIPLSNVVGQYTMLGNPFASPINWASVVKTGIEDSFWGWDPNLAYTGGYVTVTTSGSVTLIAPLTGATELDQYIQAGEGFFVRTNAPSPSLVIREQDKVSNYNPNAFRKKNDLPLLAVNLYYDNTGVKTLADGVLVTFDNSLAASKKGMATKMESANESISIIKWNESLSIDTRNLPFKNDTVLLNLARLKPGKYVLEIFGNQLESIAFKPYLHDSYLNAFQPLSAADTNTFAFSVSATDIVSADAARFQILFLDHPPAEVDAPEAIHAFPNPVKDRITVTMDDLQPGEYQFSLYTASGQLIKQQQFTHTGGSGNFIVTLDMKATNGMYFMELKSSERSLKQKVFIIN